MTDFAVNPSGTAGLDLGVGIKRASDFAVPSSGYTKGEDIGYSPGEVGQVLRTSSPEEQAALAKATQDWNDHFRVGKQPVPSWVVPFLLMAIGGPLALNAMGLTTAVLGGAGAAGTAGLTAAQQATLSAALSSSFPTAAAATTAGTALAGGMTAAEAAAAANSLAALPGSVAGLTATGAAGSGLGAGVGAALAGATEVSELVITAAKAGMTIPEIAAAYGIPAVTAADILSGGNGSPTLQGDAGSDTLNPKPADATVEELVVNPAKTAALDYTPFEAAAVMPVLAASAPTATGPLLQPSENYELGQTTFENPKDVIPPVFPVAPPANAGPLTQSPSSADLKGLNTTPSLPYQAAVAGENALAWAKAHPLEAAALGLTTAATVAGGGGGGSSSGSGNVPSATQLRANLSPTFHAQLPVSRMQLGQRKVNLTPEQYSNYAVNPPPGGEQAFFNYAVNPLMSPATPSKSEVVSPVVETIGPANDLPYEYAKGGNVKNFAVDGPGTGRSDDIPARLSDGEYVIDAETVALLGDGSGKAGAKRLDEMRVNLRKHKGQNLAKGRFSVNAKKPEAYLSGGRA